jgi:hypothetical protein
MELIRKWLAGSRNYYTGVVLYNHYGTDPRLKKYFEGEPDPIKQKKLEAELAAQLDPSRKPKQGSCNKETDEMPAGVDAVLQSLRHEWLPLYQRMNYLRHELDRFEEIYPLHLVEDGIPDNSPQAIARRRPIAFEILELEQRCMKIWARRDHYIDTGQLPEVTPIGDPIPENPVELGITIETLKRNIRRNTKKFNQESDPEKRTVYALNIKKYTEQIDRIMKQIKNGK